ncbi:MFS transporter [Salmonella enterica subsp. enterica]|nr:MFS transporter [Salmonella enterica subsp. enterica serovar Gombe]
MISLLWPLIIAGFALGLDAYVPAGLLPEIAIDLQTSQSMVGLGVALFTAAYAISAPFMSSFFGGLSTRSALLLGLGLFTVGNLVTMFAPSLWMLFIGRLMAGIGAGWYSPLATSCAASMVNIDLRGRALSIILAGLSIGAALGVPAGLWIDKIFGWRWTIGLIILLGLVAITGVAQSPYVFQKGRAFSWKVRFDALCSPFVLLTLSVTFCTGAASLGLYTYLAKVLFSRHMGDFINIFIWLWGTGGMVGALLIGRIIDRYLEPVRATFILIMLLCVSFIMVEYMNFIWAGIGCFVWGVVGWASLAPQQHTLVTYSPEHATVLIAWNASANYLGGATGSVLGSFNLYTHMPIYWIPVGAMVVTVVAIFLHLIKNQYT